METLQLVVMAVSAILFSIGGLCWKPARRWVLPIFLGLVTYQIPTIRHNVPYFALSLIIALHLGYGERTPTLVKFGVFCAIFSSTLWLGFTWWQPISIILTFLLFRISNTKWGQNIVYHRVWEFLTGAFLGITVASLIAR